MHKRVKIILNGIVRDEAENMELCIKSVEHLIDAVSFDDTGSVDNTIEITRNYLKKRKIPGEIFQEPWKGFPESRTKALRHAEQVAWKLDSKAIWYALFIDGDNRAYFTLDPQSLTLDCYELEQRAGDAFVNPDIYCFSLLIKLDPEKPWNWFGPTRIHETPTPPKDIGTTRTILVTQFHNWDSESKQTADVGFMHSRRAGFRSKNPYTAIGDLGECLKDIQDDYKNSRAWFYAGISAEGMGRYDLAQYFFKQRCLLSDFPDERYVAYLKRGQYYIENKKNTSKALKCFKSGINAITSRLEVPYEIVKIYRKMGLYQTGWLEAKPFLNIQLAPALFVKKIVYTFKFYDEAGICAYYAGASEVKELFEKALKSTDTDIINKTRIKKNLLLIQAKNSTLLADGDVIEDLNLDTINVNDISAIAPLITKYYNDKKWIDCIQLGEKLPDWTKLPVQPLLNYGVAAYWADKKVLSFTINNHISDSCKCSAEEYKLSVTNNEFSIESIKNLYISYPAKTVQTLKNVKKPANPRVTMILLHTGKQLEPCINSFLNCCIDIVQIDQWIILDTIGNTEIKSTVEKLYPFFTWVYTDPGTEIGKIHELLTTKSEINIRSKYLLYGTDKYKWIAKKAYITKFLEILDTNESLPQIAFNKNYMEEYKWNPDGIEKWTVKGSRYIEYATQFKFFPGIYKSSEIKNHKLEYGGKIITIGSLPTINMV